VLVSCYGRLAATRAELLGAGPVRASPITAPAYADPAELGRRNWRLVADSLSANQAADIAEGRLLDVREAVTSFGFHLAVVDLRQNSDVHERVVAELLTSAGRRRRLPGPPESRRNRGAGRRSWAIRACPARPTATTARKPPGSWPSSTAAARLPGQFGPGAIANYVISKAASAPTWLEVAILLRRPPLHPRQAPGWRLRIVPPCSRPSTTCGPARG